ncbi:transposase [Nonomuraea terrae]|uniref:transposase n=1 Tax=Nonomuraea terrae TaxID=2530383 RepID=UPI0037910ABA
MQASDLPRCRAQAFLRARRDLGRKYPAIVKLWEDAWADFVLFRNLVTEIRRVICSTNAIGSDQRPDSAGGPRGRLPDEQGAIKCVYMAIMSLDPTGKGRKGWITRWKAALNAFAITFEGRLTSATR